MRASKKWRPENFGFGFVGQEAGGSDQMVVEQLLNPPKLQRKSMRETDFCIKSNNKCIWDEQNELQRSNCGLHIMKMDQKPLETDRSSLISRKQNMMPTSNISNQRQIYAKTTKGQKQQIGAKTSNLMMVAQTNTNSNRFWLSHWPTLVISLLILNLPNQFGAQTIANNNDVILKLSTTPKTKNTTSAYLAPPNERVEQHQEENRFKYHLNHLRPPSLVPITIQQAEEDTFSSSSSSRSLSTASTKAYQNGLSFTNNDNLNFNQSPRSSNNRTKGPHLGRHQRALGGQEANEQLVQLQLPLQLHLKLRPLPLPMPPPPPTITTNKLPQYSSTHDDQRQVVESFKSDEFDLIGEKRKRSLEPPASTTTPTPPTQNNNNSIVNTEPTMKDNNDDLMTMVRREAKRVLILNSMLPSLISQANFERRTNTANDMELPMEWKISSLHQPFFNFKNNNNSSATNHLNQVLEGKKDIYMDQQEQNMLQQTTNPPNSVPKGEVRRQRHSSQQLQGQFNLQPTSVSDARMEAMAAAMLPLIWPSFQLTADGGGQQSPWLAQSTAAAGKEVASDLGGSSSPLPAPQQTGGGGGWPMKYTQLSRPDRQQQSVEVQQNNGVVPTTATTTVSPLLTATSVGNQLAAVNSVPQVASPPPNDHGGLLSNDEVDSDDKSSKVRAKRRKPSYLVNQQSSTPYPDSTRLANKYPMPKIKFRAIEQSQSNSQRGQITVQKQAPTSKRTAPNHQLVRQTSGPEVVSKKQQQVLMPNLPKSLSKLIEQQLLVNATNLLLHHKGQSHKMPPTTSISKVVRLSNATEVHQQVVGQDPQGQSVGSTRQLVSGRLNRDPVTSLKRHSPTRMQTHSLSVASSTMSPVTISSPMTTTISVTSSTSTTTTTTTTTSTTSKPPSAGYTATSTKRPRLIASSTTPTAQVTSTTSEASIVTITSTSTTPAPANNGKLLLSEQQLLPKRPLGLIGRKRGGGGGGGNGSRKRDKLEEQALGSNRILPEPEEEHPLLGEVKEDRNVTTRARSDSPFSDKQRKLSQANGIKLFHFKRKPDMNKLPFYKKPLNYTELGWTQEQIQEHQESLRRAAELAGETGDESVPNYLLNPSNSLIGERQKRKRRGKNHFDKLMGELHSNSNSNSNGKQQSSDDVEEDENSEENSDAEDTTKSADIEEKPSVKQQSNEVQASNEQTTTEQQVNTKAAEERVPVMRKKTEPLVLRPMFSVMNQKRRLISPSAPSPNENSQPEENLASTSSLDNVQPVTSEQLVENSQNVSRPVVRMRRKHHGEQPSNSFLAPPIQTTNQDEPWKPSKPFWSSGERVLLMPSGLLTPSGHQVVPFLASANHQLQVESSDERNRLALELLSWRPARQQQPVTVTSPTNHQWTTNRQQQQQQQQQTLVEQPAVKSNDGLAPSGEEGFLKAPGSGGETTAEQAQQQLANSSEFRVPKLMIKPMRPAKYSLNGYIPKPSLGPQQQQQLQQQVSAPQGKAQQQWPPRSRRTGLTNPAHNTNGKDLDSSTSNEVFSRRRGFQQRQSKSHSLLSFLSGGRDNNNNAAADSNETGEQLSAHLKQLEENKRKYIVQPTKSSPTLSVQKANLIKAKLGLIVTTMQHNTNSSKSPLSTDSATSLQQQQVGDSQLANGLTKAAHLQSNAIPTTFRSGSSSNSGKGDQLVATGDQIPIAGATPLSTIPKTDFECTDPKGRFVAGLFADFKTGCQVWHLCSNNRKYSFLCPSGTIFSAKLRICDWKYNVKCENSLPLH